MILKNYPKNHSLLNPPTFSEKNYFKIFGALAGQITDFLEYENCQQPTSMSNASGMLQILDLVSLARLAG